MIYVSTNNHCSKYWPYQSFTGFRISSMVNVCPERTVLIGKLDPKVRIAPYLRANDKDEFKQSF